MSRNLPRYWHLTFRIDVWNKNHIATQGKLEELIIQEDGNGSKQAQFGVTRKEESNKNYKNVFLKTKTQVEKNGNFALF